MRYYNYPNDKIDIFEPSDKNYFYSANEFTYLCSPEELRGIDSRFLYSRRVVVIYKRYAVVQNGNIVYQNNNFHDGYVGIGRYGDNGFVIIANKPRSYFIYSWKRNLQSYEISDDSKHNSALNPIIYRTAEVALQAAIELSKESDDKFMVAQWFNETEAL